MSVTPIIETKDLKAWFGPHQVLKGINMKIEPLKVTAMIGPSGCGKSTFIRALNRMHEEVLGAKLQGEVLYGGADIYDRSQDIVALRRKIGMVFQKPNPFPGMSIFENVICGLRLVGVKSKSILAEAVENSLKQAALWDEVKDKLNKPGTSLSGGQQQRLCIARALAVNPEVLLMDEPTSALDPISTAKIEELVVDLKSHVTILMVTHNMQQAARVSNKTAFFLAGELIEFGKTSQIFTTPHDPRTESYVTGRYG